MGLFLSLSGVIGSSAEDVCKALKAYVQENSGGFELAEGTTDNSNIGVITKDTKNTSILYPSGFMNWDESSRYLSQNLSKPVFSFHIHDGDFWMYALFFKGQQVDCFNPVPEYWQEITEEEKEKWRGNPQVITSIIPYVSLDSISKYLIQWDPSKKRQEKSYPDDEFCILDCWQMCDFMRKLDLQYPMPDKRQIPVDTFKLWTEDCPLENVSTEHPIRDNEIAKKPWWYFW